MCMCVCVLVTFFLFSDFQIDHVYECMRECYDFMLWLDLVGCVLVDNNLFLSFIQTLFLHLYSLFETSPKSLFYLFKNSKDL
jgi:hypothetical protein